ncbi:MAG: hypothetical protein QOG31_1609 [Thermoplasmata archaeon]|jgi:hypothetical protein|nr:hypothetical protein [Thermoplasmata archaeon]
MFVGSALALGLAVLPGAEAATCVSGDTACVCVPSHTPCIDGQGRACLTSVGLERSSPPSGIGCSFGGRAVCVTGDTACACFDASSLCKDAQDQNCLLTVGLSRTTQVGFVCS